MEFPVIFELGIFRISAHTVFETLAFMVGWRYFMILRNHQADSISDDNRLWIIIGAGFGALLFSRIIGALENPHLLSENFNLIYIYQSKTVLGGLLGGLLGTELTKKILHVSKSSGDLLTFPLILAMMIGRIGCLSAGISEPTHGIPTDFILGMDLGDGIPRHPTSLYEIFWLLGTWILLLQIEKKWNFSDGSRFKVFMVLYLIYRFLVDFIKPDFRFDFGLTTIQITALLGLLYYQKVFFLPRKLIQI